MAWLDIAIPPAMLWFLNGIVVTPIARSLTNRKLSALGVPQTAGNAEEERPEEEGKVFTTYYILTDVVILGLAGLIRGLMGFYFIGFSMRSRIGRG